MIELQFNPRMYDFFLVKRTLFSKEFRNAPGNSFYQLKILIFEEPNIS